MKYPERVNPATGYTELLINDSTAPFGKDWWPVHLLLWLREAEDRIISPDQEFETTCGDKRCYNLKHLKILWRN